MSSGLFEENLFRFSDWRTTFYPLSKIVSTLDNLKNVYISPYHLSFVFVFIPLSNEIGPSCSYFNVPSSEVFSRQQEQLQKGSSSLNQSNFQLGKKKQTKLLTFFLKFIPFVESFECVGWTLLTNEEKVVLFQKEKGKRNKTEKKSLGFQVNFGSEFDFPIVSSSAKKKKLALKEKSANYTFRSETLFASLSDLLILLELQIERTLYSNINIFSQMETQTLTKGEKEQNARRKINVGAMARMCQKQLQIGFKNWKGNRESKLEVDKVSHWGRNQRLVIQTESKASVWVWSWMDSIAFVSLSQLGNATSVFNTLLNRFHSSPSSQTSKIPNSVQSTAASQRGSGPVFPNVKVVFLIGELPGGKSLTERQFESTVETELETEGTLDTDTEFFYFESPNQLINFLKSPSRKILETFNDWAHSSIAFWRGSDRFQESNHHFSLDKQNQNSTVSGIRVFIFYSQSNAWAFSLAALLHSCLTIFFSRAAASFLQAKRQELKQHQEEKGILRISAQDREVGVTYRSLIRKYDFVPIWLRVNLDTPNIFQNALLFSTLFNFFIYIQKIENSLIHQRTKTFSQVLSEGEIQEGWIPPEEEEEEPSDENQNQNQNQNQTQNDDEDETQDESHSSDDETMTQDQRNRESDENKEYDSEDEIEKNGNETPSAENYSLEKDPPTIKTSKMETKTKTSKQKESSKKSTSLFEDFSVKKSKKSIKNPIKSRSEIERQKSSPPSRSQEKQQKPKEQQKESSKQSHQSKRNGNETGEFPSKKKQKEVDSNFGNPSSDVASLPPAPSLSFLQLTADQIYKTYILETEHFLPQMVVSDLGVGTEYPSGKTEQMRNSYGFTIRCMKNLSRYLFAKYKHYEKKHYQLQNAISTILQSIHAVEESVTTNHPSSPTLSLSGQTPQLQIPNLLTLDLLEKFPTFLPMTLLDFEIRKQMAMILENHQAVSTIKKEFLNRYTVDEIIEACLIFHAAELEEKETISSQRQKLFLETSDPYLLAFPKVRKALSEGDLRFQSQNLFVKESESELSALSLSDQLPVLDPTNVYGPKVPIEIDSLSASLRTLKLPSREEKERISQHIRNFLDYKKAIKNLFEHPETGLLQMSIETNLTELSDFLARTLLAFANNPDHFLEIPSNLVLKTLRDININPKDQKSESQSNLNQTSLDYADRKKILQTISNVFFVSGILSTSSFFEFRRNKSHEQKQKENRETEEEDKTKSQQKTEIETKNQSHNTSFQEVASSSPWNVLSEDVWDYFQAKFWSVVSKFHLWSKLESILAFEDQLDVEWMQIVKFLQGHCFFVVWETTSPTQREQKKNTAETIEQFFPNRLRVASKQIWLVGEVEDLFFSILDNVGTFPKMANNKNEYKAALYPILNQIIQARPKTNEIENLIKDLVDTFILTVLQNTTTMWQTLPDKPSYLIQAGKSFLERRNFTSKMKEP